MPDASDWRILIIDDEQDILNVVDLALKDEGYQITTARHVEAGLTACTEDPLHIVLADICMPDMICKKSLLMQRLFDMVPMAADSRAAVLIEGPASTGNDLLAKILHSTVARKD